MDLSDVPALPRRREELGRCASCNGPDQADHDAATGGRDLRAQLPAPACADIGSRALEDAKIALLPDKPENATACEPEHRKPALCLGDVKAQLASIEPLPRAKPRSGNSILIVSDEYARAAARLNSPFDKDGKPEQGQVAKHARHGQDHCYPL